MRVNFEHPVLCAVNESFSALPQDAACDFLEGQVHKGYSERVLKSFPEVAYLADHFHDGCVA